jgi:hypothetical protein
VEQATSALLASAPDVSGRVLRGGAALDPATRKPGQRCEECGYGLDVRKLLLAFGVLLTGCGGSSAAPPSTTKAKPPPGAGGTTKAFTMPPSSTPTQCTVYLYGHVAQITFSSQRVDVTPACKAWVQNSARNGAYWVVVSTPGEAPSRSDLTTRCTLTDQQGAVTAVVDDSTRATYGKSACSGLVSAGWSEQSSSGGTATAPAYTDPEGTVCNKALVGPNGYCQRP